MVQHLIKQGLRNPALAREVLLEFVGRKERSVRGWPGGVRASIEVVQGGLRDIGIEVSRTELIWDRRRLEIRVDGRLMTLFTV